MQSVQLFSEATTAFGGVDLLVEQQSTKDRPLLKIKGPFLVAEKRIVLIFPLGEQFGHFKNPPVISPREVLSGHLLCQLCI